MKVLILAGGKGTRMSSLTKNNIPKPMILLNGIPILERIILSFKKNGIKDFILSVNYLHKKIMEYFKDGKKWGVNIEFIIENYPLGSGGSLYYLKDKMQDDFIVCSGDLVLDVDINKIIDFHRKNKALITIVTHPNSHPYDSDLITVDKNNRVLHIKNKFEKRNYYYNNLVSAGLYIVNNKTLKYFNTEKPLNLEHDFINSFIKSHKVFSYKSYEYIKDVGTPERLKMAEKDLQNGIVEKKNAQNKQKAIFIDRDGVINKYKGFINKVSQIELLEKVDEAIRIINSSGYLAIIVSNQPVIARGECSYKEVNEMFKKIETLLGESGAYIDGYYFCPHHPHSGYKGEIKKLKINCNCRKPNIGMLLTAVKDYNLDLSKCIIIGDTNTDVITGKNANIETFRVLCGMTENTIEKPDFVCKNLYDAVNIITSRR